MKEENLECLDIIFLKTQPGPVAKNATSGHPAGNRWPNVAFFATGPGWVLRKNISRHLTNENSLKMVGWTENFVSVHVKTCTCGRRLIVIN